MLAWSFFRLRPLGSWMSIRSLLLRKPVPDGGPVPGGWSRSGIVTNEERLELGPRLIPEVPGYVFDTFSGRFFCIRSRMRKDPVSGGRVRTRAVHQPFVAGFLPGAPTTGGSGSSLSAALACLQSRLKVCWSLELDPPFLPVSVHPGSEGRSCLVDGG